MKDSFDSDHKDSDDSAVDTDNSSTDDGDAEGRIGQDAESAVLYTVSFEIKCLLQSSDAACCD